MKITAEFNSNEELLSFIGAFGAKSFIPSQGVANTVSVITPVVEFKKVVKTEDKPVKETKVDAPKEEIKETVAPMEEAPTKEETKPEEPSKEEIKVTKEMIRERLGAIMKAGKQKEVKELVAKHGAGKLPDLKEEDYAAVYQEAEGLL